MKEVELIKLSDDLKKFKDGYTCSSIEQDLLLQGYIDNIIASVDNQIADCEE